MSPLRLVGSFALASALVLVGTSCSDDEKPETQNDRGTIEFGAPPEGSTDLGLCAGYDIEQIKELIGGENTFKQLAPEAIGSEGDDVTGEACSWERTEANGDSAGLRVEVRDFGDDTAALDEQFDALEEGTIAARPLTGLGDGAFTSESEDTALLQTRSGTYLLTVSSRSSGGLDPVSLDALELLAARGLDQLS